MKKTLLIAVILLVSSSLFAGSLFMVQGTYLNTSRVAETVSNLKTKRKYNEVGVNLTAFMGDRMGFYGSGAVFLPISSTGSIDYNSEDMKTLFDDLRLGFDSLVGVGILIPMGSKFSLLAGGGAHVNGIMLRSSVPIYDYKSINVGAGGSLNLLFNLSKGFHLNVGGLFAWDFWSLYSEGFFDVGDAKGGSTWSVSAGAGFKF